MQILTSKKTGLVVGLAFTALVVGLLIFLNVFGEAKAERFAQPMAGTIPVVSSGAPSWVEGKLGMATGFAEQKGCKFEVKNNDLGEGAIPIESCEVEAAGKKIQIPCLEDAVLVTTLIHRELLKNGHGAATHVWWTEGRVSKATIMVPVDFEQDAVIDLDGNEIQAKDLPPMVDGLALTHEMIHALGIDHAETRLCGPFVAYKTGQVMNPELSKLGWGDAGLPEKLCD